MYVIDQMLSNGIESIAVNTGIFNSKITTINPCKEILFAMMDSLSLDNNNYFNYSKDENPIITDVGLLINNKHRFNNDYLPEFIFRDYFPNNIHSVIPSKYMYCMPFSIKPEWNGQPTGSFNFSKIDDAVLSLKLNKQNTQAFLHIYPIVYNIIKIKNGALSFEWHTQ
jgi:hypothetical protein